MSQLGMGVMINMLGGLFDSHIRGKFYVEFVLDDRNQVVDLWRKEIGLPCFQVDYGAF